MAKKKIKTYRVTGKMANPNYDVDTEIKAYSVKQAKLKTFFLFKQKNGFKEIDNKDLMSQIKKLRITEK